MYNMCTYNILCMQYFLLSHNRIPLSHKKEGHSAFCDNMDGP